MKRPILSKAILIKILVISLLVTSILEIFFYHYMYGVISTFLTLMLIVIFYGSNRIARLFRVVFIKKSECPYYIQSECPYGSIDQCPYDTTFCHNFQQQKRTRWATLFVFILLILSILCSILAVLSDIGGSDMTNLGNKLTFQTWLKILSPIANSIIAAILCAFVMDIPSRMMEYQEYFVRLLSSSDYLKVMDEDDLMKLRKKVTWQLHIKDVPRMPKGLIKMDEQILDMLKRPYFKRYNQSTHVSKDKMDGMLRKIVNIEYLAHNPYSNEHPVKMDIGMANSLQFNGEVSIEEAKKLFCIKKFDLYIDSSESPIDLLKHIKVLVVDKKEDGLQYNGKVQLGTWDHNADNDLGDASDLAKENPHELDYVKCDTIRNALNITFNDKIRVQLQYEVIVPESDVCYTKRLRYPVKYFHLDYSLDPSLNYTLVGQLLGTLIDQPDVTTEMHDNDMRICMQTNNWLLPKNGAIIVHCMKQ